MIPMKVLSKNDIMQVLEMKPIIRCVEQVYCQKSEGDTVVWPTTFYEFDPGHADMDIKSGYLKGAKLYGHKTVSWFGANKEAGLPDLTGVIVIYSAETGLPLGVLDAAYITGIRTGAAGAIGAKYLARPDSRNLVICGSGNQAAFQAAAMLALFPDLEKITVYNALFPEQAVAFAEALPKRLEEEFGLTGYRAQICAEADPVKVFDDADVVITVTPARAPYIKREWIRPGTHFSCIGADMSGKEEIDPEILRGARIFVDDKKHCIEAGEIEIPLKMGVITEAEIQGEIGDLILGKVPGRQKDEEITVYDATGMALLDIAAASVALELAREKGLGQSVEL